MTDKNGFEQSDGDFGRGIGQTTQMTEAFAAELARMRESMLLTSREVSTLSSSLSGGLRRAFEGVVFDGGKLSDALKSVATTMVDTVYAVAMKPVEQAVAGSLAQSLNGLMSGIAPFAMGGAFSQGKVMPFAKGGVVGSPTLFPMRNATGLMGEAGPEAIMPLRRGADGRLGVAADGGSGRAVNVTFNISTPNAASFQRSQSQMASQVARVLSRGNRNG